MPACTEPKSLLLCVHAHQPVGNFGHVFAEAAERCYEPFFRTLERHPKVLLNVHLSGSLIDWLEKNRPELLELCRELGRRGQVEFLGGAYYEPIFGAIPRQDLHGQIKMMRERVEELFGRAPEGAWLTERVWDPDLLSPLIRSRVAYTVLDDAHLARAHVDAPAAGYYRVRNQEGAGALDVFASLKELRYLLPFGKPEETFSYLRALSASPSQALVFADDLEKFGLWPKTHARVYRHGWLEKFFGLLEKQKDVRLFTFSAFRKAFGPTRAVRIPHGSYGEMMEWCGGRFYNFFDKYTESRYMSDRMWSLSRRIRQKVFLNGFAHRAQEALYRAQCNCAYWHGVFGGLYLHHLRSAVYENLIEAESCLTAASAQGGTEPAVSAWETEELDSGPRWRLNAGESTHFFNPGYGAALEEWDFLPARANLMCNIQRRPEPYHSLVKSPDPAPASALRATSGSASWIHELLGMRHRNLGRHLFYDASRRLSFIDRFFEAAVSPTQWYRATFHDAGDFAAGRFQAETDASSSRVVFRRSGFLSRGQEQSGLEVAYAIRAGREACPAAWVFGVEFNFSVCDPRAVKGPSVVEGKEMVLEDAWRGISIRLRVSEKGTFTVVPLETVSGSEQGLVRMVQGVSVLWQRPYAFSAGRDTGPVFHLDAFVESGKP